MISIYNETQVPWLVEKLDEKRIKLVYERSYMRGDEKVSRTFGILTFLGKDTDHIDAVKKTEELSKLTGATHPTKLFDFECGVHFTPKRLTPFISALATRKRDVLVASIRTNARYISKVKTSNADFLDYLTFAGALTFSASFQIGGKITVELYDEILKRFITLIFTSTEKGIEMTKQSRKVKPADNGTIDSLKSSPKIDIRTYRPKYPTKVIFTHPKDKNNLVKLIKPEEHNIVELSKYLEDDAIKAFIDEGYTAVTTYSDVPFKEAMNHPESRRYTRFIKKLREKFSIVYILHSDGKIRVAKI